MTLMVGSAPAEAQAAMLVATSAVAGAATQSEWSSVLTRLCFQSLILHVCFFILGLEVAKI